MFSHIDPLADEDTAVDISNSTTIRSAIGFFEDLSAAATPPICGALLGRVRLDTAVGSSHRRDPGSPASGIAQPDASLARPAGHRRSLYL
jgi:hypothetical protein